MMALLHLPNSVLCCRRCPLEADFQKINSDVLACLLAPGGVRTVVEHGGDRRRLLLRLGQRGRRVDGAGAAARA